MGLESLRSALGEDWIRLRGPTQWVWAGDRNLYIVSHNRTYKIFFYSRDRWWFWEPRAEAWLTGIHSVGATGLTSTWEEAKRVAMEAYKIRPT